jgi:choline dehydrogenase
MANRLSEDSSARVLVLEAGMGDVPETMDIPYTWPTFFGSEYDWGYKTVPQPGLNGREISQPSGRAIGGSSNLYHMIHIRGHKSDFDNWAYRGASGWAWDDVLPYFQKVESQEDDRNPTAGKSGPMNLTAFADDKNPTNPASAAFIEACAELGYPMNEDFNAGGEMLGAGWHHTNIKDGKRFSARSAYLYPALKRSNVTLSAESVVSRLLFEGTRCVGVEYIKNGQVQQVRAEKEVVLCAGTIQSPKILMLSGIGNPEQLKQFNIPVLVDLPGVGENFHDHVLVVGPILKCNTVFPAPQLNISEVALFWKSDPSWLGPDLQIGFVHSPSDVVPQVDDRSIVTLLPGLVRVFSRGWVRLASADPMQNPLSNPNYLSDSSDLERMKEGVKVARGLVASKAFGKLEAFEVFPGSDVKTDDDIRGFLRQNADSYWHYAGSCKMGVDDMAVVDPQLRVHGVDGLRVADGAVMPMLPSSNCHAAILMIAERGADMVKSS